MLRVTADAVRISLIAGILVNGKVVHEGLSHGIDGEAVISDVCDRRVDRSLGRNLPGLHRLRNIPLTLVEQKEKSFVLYDGPADVHMELIDVGNRRLALGNSAAVTAGVGKKIVGVANTAVIDPRRSAMPGVGAALHAQYDRGSALNSKLSRGCLLHAQFLDGFRRERNRRNAQNPGLIDGRVAVVTVIVIEPVNKIVVGCCPRTVDADGEESSAGIALHSGRHCQERIEVAAIDRNILDLFAIHVVVFVGREIDQRRAAFHFHRLRSLPDRQFEFSAGNRAG